MSERSGDWGAGLSPGVEIVLAAGSEAKTMTSLLNIPTVLVAACYFTISFYFEILILQLLVHVVFDLDP